MITVADMPNSDYAHYVPYCKSNKELTEDTKYRVKKIVETLTFNSNGKYIFSSASIKVISAKATSGNYFIMVGNAQDICALVLYNIEGTSFTRVTSAPSIEVEYYVVES